MLRTRDRLPLGRFLEEFNVVPGKSALVLFFIVNQRFDFFILPGKHLPSDEEWAAS